MPRVMPRDAINQKTVMADGDQQTVYNLAQDRNDNAELSDIKTYHQGTLPAEIAQNVSDISDIQDGTLQLNPRSAVAGRFDFEEPTLFAITVGGWWEIARTAQSGNQTSVSDFKIGCQGTARESAWAVRVSDHNSINSIGRKLDVLSKTGPTALGSFGIEEVRLVYNDSVANSGAKLEVFIDVSTTLNLTRQLLGNFSNIATRTGWTLSVPTQLNVDKCPDGSAGSFLTQKEAVSTQRILWTGPLSVVTTPTSLNSGESFDDWDQIIVDMSLDSDVDNFFTNPNIRSSISPSVTIRSYKGTNHLTFQELTSTTFQINSKTVTQGNIQRIIGIKL